MPLYLDPNNNGRSYDVGDVVEVRAWWTSPGDPSGSPVDVDPLAATCAITPPTGNAVEINYPGANTEKREYTYLGRAHIEIQFRYAATMAGRHTYVVTATGAAAAAEKGTFFVRDI